MKNKRIETVTCSMSPVIEPELYCKITPMYKCCWHWTNQCLINKQCQIQWNRNNGLFKVSRRIVNAKETNDTCCWYETNRYLVSKQGKKQIIRKEITGTMTCSKSATNALGLSKQDNTNDTCAADLEQIIIWLANNTVNKITEIMTCSKPTVNASGSC